MKALVGTSNQRFTCLHRVEGELDPVSCYTLAGLPANCQSQPQLFLAAARTPAQAGPSPGTREQRRTHQYYRAFQGRQTVMASRYLVAKSRDIQ